MQESEVGRQMPSKQRNEISDRGRMVVTAAAIFRLNGFDRIVYEILHVSNYRLNVSVSLFLLRFGRMRSKRDSVLVRDKKEKDLLH